MDAKHANRLRIKRAERDLTQWDVALKTGMSQTKYWQIEQGLREPNSVERRALARALRSTVGELFPPAPEGASRDAATA